MTTLETAALAGFFIATAILGFLWIQSPMPMLLD